MINEYDEQVLEKIRDFLSLSGEPKNLANAEERVKRFADTFSRMTGEKLKDLYATCGSGDCEKGFFLRDLWLFSDRYIMLVDGFGETATDTDSFKLFSARKRINSVRVTAEKYDFDSDSRSFQEDSMLRLECMTADNIQINREAHGPYCPRLARVIKQWILPNLV